MRKPLALAALAAAAATLVPATSASAQCVTTPVGGCLSPCSIVSGTYHAVDDAVGGALPPLVLNCTL
jgi:hypothetical protein